MVPVESLKINQRSRILVKEGTYQSNVISGDSAKEFEKLTISVFARTDGMTDMSKIIGIARRESIVEGDRTRKCYKSVTLNTLQVLTLTLITMDQVCTQNAYSEASSAFPLDHRTPSDFCLKPQRPRLTLRAAPEETCFPARRLNREYFSLSCF